MGQTRILFTDSDLIRHMADLFNAMPYGGWIVVGFTLIGLSVWGYRRLHPQHRPNVKRVYALIILGLEIVRLIYYRDMGQFSPGILPLHLCSLTVFLIVIYAFTSSKLVKESLYAMGLATSVLGFIYADSLLRDGLNFVSIQSFISHGLMVGFIFMTVFAKEITPELKRLPGVFGLYLILAAGVYVFNKTYHTHFWFLNGSIGMFPLTVIESVFGNPGYIFIVMGLIVLAWGLLYLPLLIQHFTKKTKRSNHASIDPNPNVVED